MLNTLINKGDHVAILNGELKIQPASGKPVPDDWYQREKHNLVIEITQVVGKKAYLYESYSTGNYNVKAKTISPGITLQFIDLTTGERPYAVFNIDLKRARATKNHKKGDPLSQNKFLVPEKSGFRTFWIKSCLPTPRYPSEYCEKMGKLKEYYFTLTTNEHGKIINSSLISLTIPYELILEALNSDNTKQNKVGKNSGTYREKFGNESGAKLGKQLTQYQYSKGSQLNSTTCNKNYGNKVIREDVNKLALHSTERTVDDLKEDTNHLRSPTQPENQTTDEWTDIYNAHQVP